MAATYKLSEAGTAAGLVRVDQVQLASLTRQIADGKAGAAGAVATRAALTTHTVARDLILDDIAANGAVAE